MRWCNTIGGGGGGGIGTQHEVRCANRGMVFGVLFSSQWAAASESDAAAHSYVDWHAGKSSQEKYGPAYTQTSLALVLILVFVNIG